MRPCLRPSAAVLAVLTLTGGIAGTATAAPASPAPPASGPSCSVSGPAVVTSASTSTTVELRLGQSCPPGSIAAWRVVAPSGRTVARVTLVGRRAKPVSIPTTTAAAFGQYRLAPVSGSDADNGLLFLAPGTLTVKAGSRLSVAVSGSRVSTAATRYDVRTKRFVPWSGAITRLERKVCTGTVCRWTVTASTTADRRGAAALRVPATHGTYRVTTVPTATIGGRGVTLPTR